ncbi:MAG: hypothetical protein WD766_10455 [Gemmatimonadota bacterium]
MADIDIEQKDSVGWIWWVLGLVLIGLVAFLLAGALGDDEVALEDEAVAPIATEPMPPAEPMTDQPMAVQQFIESCGTRAPAEMGLDHQYTSSCVQDLVNAIDGVAPADEINTLGLTTQMETAREAADNLRESAPDVERHSEMTRNAFTSIATLADELQNERFPALEANAQQLTQAAESVTADTPLLDQREAVQTFFARAGDLLQGMNAPTTAGAI